MLRISRSKLLSRYLPMFLSVVVLVTTFAVYYTSQKSKVAEGAWYNASWSYRKSITIDKNKLSITATSTFSSFPLLFSVTDSDLKTISNGGKVASSTGADILFTDSDGTTKLDHEIEKYASTTGETIVWVRIPTLTSSSNYVIYIYYGNAAAADQQNAAGVWDSNFVAVYHLPNGTTLTALDSTANAINGTLTNTPTAGTGQMDGAGSFVSASSQYINLSDNGAFNTTAITYSAWVKATSFANGYNSIIQKVLSANSYSQLFVKSDGKLAVYMYATAGVNYDGSGSNTLSTGTWYYITATYDSSAGLKSYVNASVDASVAANGGLAYNNATTYISHDSFTTPRYWDGQIDEARVSNIARSADWIATEYNNQSSPSTFYVLGGSSVQNPTGGAGVDIASRGTGTSWYNTSWTYRKQITIDRTKLSTTATSTFSSFPLLFSVTDTDLKYTGSGGKVASSTGGDILFTASDGTTKLDHELEKYSSSTGETIAWIRIPTLAASSDHTLYIYFGNSGASNQQNATGVWDFNYKGVWHLPDGTNLTVLDSTGVNNGTNTGVTATSSKVDGGGAYADTNDRVESAIAPNYSSLTLEAWVKPNYFSSATAGFIFGNGNSGDSGTGFYFNMNGNNPINGGDFIIGNGHPYGGPNATWSQTLTENTWYHFVATWTDGVAPKIYINGSLNVTGTVGGAGALQTSGNNLSIGGNQTLSGVYFLKGVGDEFRVSNSVRSADWILTEYNNQSSPSTFYAYGALQAQTRQSSSGAPAPAVKSRGGVKFR